MGQNSEHSYEWVQTIALLCPDMPRFCDFLAKHSAEKNLAIIAWLVLKWKRAWFYANYLATLLRNSLIFRKLCLTFDSLLVFYPPLPTKCFPWKRTLSGKFLYDNRRCWHGWTGRHFYPFFLSRASKKSLKWLPKKSFVT